MQQIPVLTISMPVATPVPEQRFIGLDGHLCAAGAAAWGVSDAPVAAAGGIAAVKVLGTSKVQFGAAGLAAGSLVMSDANGQAVAVANGGAALARIIAPAGAIGGIGEVLLLPTNAAA